MGVLDIFLDHPISTYFDELAIDICNEYHHQAQQCYAFINVFAMFFHLLLRYYLFKEPGEIARKYNKILSESNDF